MAVVAAEAWHPVVGAVAADEGQGAEGQQQDEHRQGGHSPPPRSVVHRLEGGPPGPLRAEAVGGGLRRAAVPLGRAFVVEDDRPTRREVVLDPGPCHRRDPRPSLDVDRRRVGCLRRSRLAVGTAQHPDRRPVAQVLDGPEGRAVVPDRVVLVRAGSPGELRHHRTQCDHHHCHHCDPHRAYSTRTRGRRGGEPDRSRRERSDGGDRGQPAVDRQMGAGDERGLVGEEEPDGPGDLLRARPAVPAGSGPRSAPGTRGCRRPDSASG